MKAKNKMLKNDLKEKLELLKEKEEEAKNDMEALAEEYSLKLPDIIEVSSKINKLPIESLKELYDFESGQMKQFNTLMALKTELEKKKQESESKLDAINTDIKLSKIDILLSEIDNLSKSLI